MGRKAGYSLDELQQIHKQMLDNKWTVKDAAKNNTVKQLEKMTLYMAFRRHGLSTKLEKSNEVSV